MVTASTRTTTDLNGGRTRGASLCVTVYGCEVDEATLFQEKGPAFGVNPIITAAPLSAETVALAQGSRSISIDHKSPIDKSVLDALSVLGVRYISTRSVGSNHLDVEYAERVGISVGSTLYSADSVADFTLMLMLMTIRRARATLSRADLHDYRLPEVRGRELRDLTVGVVGTGRIGTAVIERLRGFGCRTVAYDIRPKTSAHYLALDDLLQQSDIVTLHTPLNGDTHHLLDRDRIDRLKPGAFVINTGRGGLLDTGSLIDALESGRLGGLALDVLEDEEGMFYSDHRNRPPESEALRRLRDLPNAIVTPHTAFFTDHALNDTVVNSLLNCLRFEKGLQHD